MFKHAAIVLLLVFSSAFGECVFPNPCSQDGKNFTTLSNSEQVKNIVKEKKAEANTINWAWSRLFSQSSIGAKRLSAEAPDTLPIGEILLQNNGLTIGFDSDKAEKISELKILNLDTGKTVFTQKEINNLITVPKNALSLGNKYKLTCNVYTKSSVLNINETFKILPQSSHDEFEKSFSLASANAKTQTEKDFIKAVLYYEYGYEHNGNIKILELKGVK